MEIVQQIFTLPIYFVTIWFILPSDCNAEKLLYTYNPNKATWNDATNYCIENGGILVTLQDNSKNMVITTYKSTIWSGVWNDHVWIALYQDSVDYKWQGRCNYLDRSGFTNWDSEDDEYLDYSKPCVYATSNDLFWKNEVCSQQFAVICQKAIGECTFEDKGVNYCVPYDINDFIVSASFEECKLYCQTWIKSNRECWAVTYDDYTYICYGSFSKNPFHFDHQFCPPESHTVVSLKRCFEGEIKHDHIPSADFSIYAKPYCTTTMSTTTNIPTTTTTLFTTSLTTAKVTGVPTFTDMLITNPLTTGPDISTADKATTTDDFVTAQTPTTTRTSTSTREITADSTSENVDITSKGDLLPMSMSAITDASATSTKPSKRVEVFTAQSSTTTDASATSTEPAKQGEVYTVQPSITTDASATSTKPAKPGEIHTAQPSTTTDASITGIASTTNIDSISTRKITTDVLSKHATSEMSNMSPSKTNVISNISTTRVKSDPRNITPEVTNTRPFAPENVSTASITWKHVIGNCKCNCLYGLTNNLTVDAFNDLLSELKIDKKNTSSARRKLFSADDKRASSKILGYTGVAFISFVGFILLAIDFGNLFNMVVVLFKSKHGIYFNL